MGLFAFPWVLSSKVRQGAVLVVDLGYIMEIDQVHVINGRRTEDCDVIS